MLPQGALPGRDGLRHIPVEAAVAHAVLFVERVAVRLDVRDEAVGVDVADVEEHRRRHEAPFSVAERVEMILAVTKDLTNVVVDCHDGLLADYLERTGACAIVKGLRAVSDFEYEFQQALANKKLCAGAETVFLTTSTENMYLSSSMVKEISRLGGDISDFVPTQIRSAIINRMTKDQ